MNAYSIAATTPLSFGLQTGSRESLTPQKRKARILVVDDDPGLLRLLTIRLRGRDYEVEAVESAAAALAACVRSSRPDLVITDLRMDQMDGIGLLKELQSRWPGLRVIILTAHGTIPGRRACHAKRRLRLSDQAGRQAGFARSRAKSAQSIGLRACGRGLALQHRHPQSADGGQAGAGQHGGRHRCAGAADRRERDGQGTAGARDSRGEPAAQ